MECATLRALTAPPPLDRSFDCAEAGDGFWRQMGYITSSRRVLGITTFFDKFACFDCPRDTRPVTVRPNSD